MDTAILKYNCVLGRGRPYGAVNRLSESQAILGG